MTAAVTSTRGSAENSSPEVFPLRFFTGYDAERRMPGSHRITSGAEPSRITGRSGCSSDGTRASVKSFFSGTGEDAPNGVMASPGRRGAIRSVPGKPSAEKTADSIPDGMDASRVSPRNRSTVRPNRTVGSAR